MHYTHRSTTPSQLHVMGLSKFDMFGYGGDHPRLPHAIPGALVVFLVEVLVEDAVWIELDLLIARAVLAVAHLLLLLLPPSMVV